MEISGAEVHAKVERTKDLMKGELLRHGSDPLEFVEQLEKVISEVLHADEYSWDEWLERQYFEHLTSELLDIPLLLKKA